MIKINLLPKTINQKAILRNTALVFGALFVAVVAGGITFNMKLSDQVRERVAEAERLEALKAQVDSLNGQATTILSSAQPIRDKVDFIEAVLAYNLKYPELYKKVADWTYERVQYTSLNCNGSIVTINARVKNLDDLGRYLLNMYRATDLFTSVTISGVQNAGFGQSTYATAPGAMGAMGMTGMPGMPPGGAPVYQPMPMGAPSMAGIGAISAGVERAPGQNTIDFTVTCVLKTPIVPPVYKGAAGAGQQAGADPNMNPAPMPTSNPS